MSKCKTKAIQTDLGTFRHNQSFPGIIQAYLESWYIQNPGIFINPVYSECWHIQSPRHIR